MQYDHDETTLTPQSIVDAFQRAYWQVYGQEAQVVHMFAQWYTVNGETVHRMTLFSEIARLRDLAQHQQAQQRLAEQQAQLAYYQQAQQRLAEQQAQLEQHQQAQERLAQQQAQQRPAPKPFSDRSMVQRLIARLRGT